ncbi:CUB and sushi domain-containing protein 3-like, partial [Acanthaster planci]|uniref:CUB and sushi domain-containing protein 3-like n=1 Tax=Acanthaster planci TaxID=133434 RepID=A0A8B7ZNM3_ACAPL
MEAPNRLRCILLFLIPLWWIQESSGTYISPGSHTRISSPGFPGYWDYASASWTVSTTSNWRIRISFSEFQTESSYDPLRIVDSASGQDWSFSGSSLPGDVISTGSSMHLTFTSDGSVTARGFILYAYSIPMPTAPTTSSLSLRDASGTRLHGTESLLEGVPFTFTCDVQDTSPAVTIRWYLDGALQDTAAAPSGGEYSLVDTSDSWTLTPGRDDHDREVKCEASNTESQQPYPFVRVTLNVI